MWREIQWVELMIEWLNQSVLDCLGLHSNGRIHASLTCMVHHWSITRSKDGHVTLQTSWYDPTRNLFLLAKVVHYIGNRVAIEIHPVLDLIHYLRHVRRGMSKLPFLNVIEGESS